MTDLDTFRFIRNRVGFHRSKSWLKFVKGYPCVKCGQPADDPHHVFGSFGPKKTSDFAVVPVCRSCHEYLERHPEHNRQVIPDLVVFLVARMAEIDAISERV